MVVQPVTPRCAGNIVLDIVHHCDDMKSLGPGDSERARACRGESSDVDTDAMNVIFIGTRKVCTATSNSLSGLQPNNIH